MPCVHLTSKLIDSLKTELPVEDYWDECLKNFVLRVTKAGVKSYSIVYRNQQGERKRFRFGDAKFMSLAEARSTALSLLAIIEQGQDPNESKKAFKRSNTVEELCDLYLKYHAEPNKRATSAEKDRQTIARDIRPKIGKYKISEVKRADIIGILDHIRHERGAPIQANRTRALLHKLFGFAVERGLIEFNPCSGVKLPSKEHPRTRVLNEKELSLLISVLEEYKERNFANLLLILLLTGQRIGEVANMKWDEIEGDIWTIPAHKAKNGEGHGVPLGKWVLEILEDQRKVNEESFSERVISENYVFNTVYGPGFKYIYKALGRFYLAVEETARAFGLSNLSKWNPHDFRRTVATFLENEGVSSDAIDRLQNHVKGKVRRVYQRGQRIREIEKALSCWEKFLIQLTSNSVNEALVA